jgi:large subunit ribosomal protein L18
MKHININRKLKQKIRHKRITNKLKHVGSVKPRLVVSKSNIHLVAQIIDDNTSKTLVSYSSIMHKKPVNLEVAKIIGETIAKKAIEKNIKEVVFDRGGNKYHGLIKALADEARKNGLIF